MYAVTGQNEVCNKIAEALGIKYCISLDLHMSVDEIVSVKAEFYPEIDVVKSLEPILKEYELIEKTKEQK